MTSPRVDGHRRAISYLRISITDRCNLRCLYCMPEEGIEPLEHSDILHYEEIARVTRVAASLGISKVRVTGGEPLVRRGVAQLVAMLAGIEGIDDLSITTNATRLAPMAAELASAGLQRVNISLDTLRPDRFRTITRRGELADAMAGIAAAQAAGLRPVKINTVVIRGVNSDEALDFARRTLVEDWHVRFIELMPLGENSLCFQPEYVPADEIRREIEEEFGSLEAAKVRGNGPAMNWRVPGAVGTLGFISAISHHFCAGCNRLRLAADGKLVPCLFSDLEFDLRGPLRSGADDAELRRIFERAIELKPDRHHLEVHKRMTTHEMSRLGG